jgi:predicted peptidase
MTQINIPLGKEPGAPYGYVAYEVATPKWLIVSLHGQGEIGNGKSELTRVRNIGVAEWIDKGTVLPAGVMAVSPQCPTKGGFYHVTLENYIRAMCLKYGVSRENVSTLGVSQGGNSALEHAVRYPVHAVVSIAAWGTPKLAYKAINVKLWAFHGSHDRTVLPSGSINFVNAYNAAKPSIPAKLDIFPFETHSNYVWDKVCQQREIYEWMTT